MHNIGYVAQGYNIFYGNPKPTKTAGADPGFSQFAGSSIFQHTYTGGHTTADGRYLIPDGFDLQVDFGCALDFTSFSTSKASEYTSDLKVDVVGSGSYDGVSFSASVDYQGFAKRTSSSKQRMVSSTAECAVYKAGLQTYSKPNLTDNFVTASSQLPADYGHGNTYFDFIDAFGTHYPVEVVFGSRYGFISYFDEAGWTSVEKTNISVEVAASYDGVVKAGGNLSTQSEKTAQQAFSSSHKYFSIVSLGTPPTKGDPVQWAQQVVQEPMPIRYTLVSVCTAVPENRRDNCNRAMFPGEYCTKRLLQSRHAVSTCNEVLDLQCLWDRDCGTGEVCSEKNQCETAPRQEVRAYWHGWNSAWSFHFPPAADGEEDQTNKYWAPFYAYDTQMHGTKEVRAYWHSGNGAWSFHFPPAADGEEDQTNKYWAPFYAYDTLSSTGTASSTFVGASPAQTAAALKPSSTADCNKVPGINTGLPIVYDPSCPAGAGCFEDYPCRYSSAVTGSHLRR